MNLLFVNGFSVPENIIFNIFKNLNINSNLTVIHAIDFLNNTLNYKNFNIAIGYSLGSSILINTDHSIPNLILFSPFWGINSSPLSLSSIKKSHIFSFTKKYKISRKTAIDNFLNAMQLNLDLYSIPIESKKNILDAEVNYIQSLYSLKLSNLENKNFKLFIGDNDALTHIPSLKKTPIYSNTTILKKTNHCIINILQKLNLLHEIQSML